MREIAISRLRFGRFYLPRVIWMRHVTIYALRISHIHLPRIILMIGIAISVIRVSNVHLSRVILMAGIAISVFTCVKRGATRGAIRCTVLSVVWVLDSSLELSLSLILHARCSPLVP